MARSRQAVAGELGWAMQHYQRSVQAFDDAVGRWLGLGPADVRCLDWLADGAKTASELSRATGLRPAATTALIDRLSDKGFVRRVRSETDRRQVLVEMTDEGQQRTWQAYGPLVEEGVALLAGIPLAELEAMRAHLEAMRELTERHRARIEAAS